MNITGCSFYVLFYLLFSLSFKCSTQKMKWRFWNILSCNGVDLACLQESKLVDLSPAFLKEIGGNRVIG